MRICVLTRGYPVPTETFVADSAAALASCGHQVRLLARRRGPAPLGAQSRLPAEYVAGWPARVAELLRHPRRWAREAASTRTGPPAGVSSCWDAPQRARIPAVAGADCVLAHFGYVGADWLPAVRLARRRLAVYFHGSDITRWLRRAPALYRPLFGSGAGLLTNSAFLRDRLVEAGADPRRLRVVPLAAHGDFAAREGPPPLDRPRVLTVARLVEKKGLDAALTAFALARPALGDGWRYTIVGDGPWRRRLESLARELQVAGRVDFVPRATRAGLVELVGTSSIFLLASRTASNGDTEGTPVALIEAATAGLPVVATAHAGIPELLPADARARGFLVGERDVEAMAAALARLGRSLADRREWASACLAHARRRTPAREGRDLSEALDQVAAVPA